MKTLDWMGQSEKHLVEIYGWPRGTTNEVATWLCTSISDILEHSERPLATHEVYEALRAERYRTSAPEQWRRAVVIDFLYAAVDRALRSIAATAAWIPEHSWSDPYILLKRSRRDALTSVVRDRTFVCGSIDKKGTRRTYCPNCIPEKLKKKLGEGYVDTWEEGSDGWTSVPVCEVCHSSIRIVIGKTTY